jgi:hypothetical protein
VVGVNEISVKKFGFPVVIEFDGSGRAICFCGCGGLLVEVQPGSFMCPDWAPVHQALRQATERFFEELLITGSGSIESAGPTELLAAISSPPLWSLESGLRFQRAGECRTADLSEFSPPVDWDAALRALGRAGWSV